MGTPFSEIQHRANVSCFTSALDSGTCLGPDPKSDETAIDNADDCIQQALRWLRNRGKKFSTIPAPWDESKRAAAELPHLEQLVRRYNKKVG